MSHQKTATRYINKKMAGNRLLQKSITLFIIEDGICYKNNFCMFHFLFNFWFNRNNARINFFQIYIQFYFYIRKYIDFLILEICICKFNFDCSVLWIIVNAHIQGMSRLIPISIYWVKNSNWYLKIYTWVFLDLV